MQTSWGPENTPQAIQRLILATATICILSALIEPIFNEIFGLQGLQYWLSLSWAGIKNFCLWQPLTYPFVQYTGTSFISLSFLLSLAFNLYILWVMGTAVLESIGTSAFLRLYFLSAIFAGLLALAMMKLTGQYSILSGAFPPILALLTVWTFLHPETEILLFFVIPIKAKWLLAAILGAAILINLSQRAWVDLSFFLGGAFFGYLYATLVGGMRSPWTCTWGLDKFLNLLGKTLGKKIFQTKGEPKIFDFKTGNPLLDDEQFVDAMLSKISQKGPNSLSLKEKNRMEAISLKKRKKN